MFGMAEFRVAEFRVAEFGMSEPVTLGLNGTVTIARGIENVA